MSYRYNPLLDFGLDYYESEGSSSTVTRQGVTTGHTTGKILFSTPLTGTYALELNVHDTNGIPVGFILGLKELDGFTITCSESATVEHLASQI